MSFTKKLILSSFLFHHVAPLSVPIPRTGWSATADSYNPGNEPSKAIDGDVGSFWHSAYNPTIDPLPNTITIDMQNKWLVNAVSVTPRQDGTSNGNIGQHKIELSEDGQNWGSVVANGRYINDASTKQTTFVRRPARYVRITALTEAQSDTNQWTSAAEINVYSDAAYVSRTDWRISADSEETQDEQDQATNALDGLQGTFWHTRYSNGGAPLPHWFQIDQGSSKSVAGLSYLPRVNNANGRIGKFTVGKSDDGNTWTKISEGTWVDDGAEKVAMFTSTARYFRLNALSEAGNRGGFSSASEINLISSVAPSYSSPASSRGLWQNTVDFPIVPAAAAVLPNGKVLLWASYRVDAFGGANGYTQSAIYDPTTGIVSPRTVTNTQHDMFCPGISYTFDGRVIVTGGDNNIKTSIYDPSQDAWVAGPNMKKDRGYQSTAITSEGKVFNIGGSWGSTVGGKDAEIWDPSANSWALVQNAKVAPMLTADRAGDYRADNHGWLFGWKNGTVFQAGPSKAMNWYKTGGTGGVSSAGTRSDDGDSMNGNAVMYDAVAGKILTAGGATNYQGDDARKNAYVITIDKADNKPTVTKIDSMAYARGFANGIVLPDGSVFVTGGQAHVEPFTDTTATLIPELWNPVTGKWTQMNPMSIARTYHSVGLLLADATVLNGGGGLCGDCGSNHWDAEIFVPPYLLNDDGSRKTRPTITKVAATIGLGKAITIETGGTIKSFALVRLGTSTHTVNTDQRRVPLAATQGSSSTVWTVTIPSDAGVVMPGLWFLFAIDGNGTPSVAKTVKVTA